ncbi:MAG: hypothetical protein FWC27_15685 [Firmicutes bacterium]|nr:hypothetical protein [Bacillota bacterium]
MEHLAIMDKETIEKIMNGEKLIESRFSKHMITPFRRVSVGDTVYLKVSSGDILATFEVGKVIYLEGLTREKINDVSLRYGNLINAPIGYFDRKMGSSFGTLMYVKNPKWILPTKISKKGRAAFVSAESILKKFEV